MPLFPALNIDSINPEWLKENYLGIQLVNPATGAPLSDDFYKYHLNVACSILERDATMSIIPTTVEREAHDYRIEDYQQFAFFVLYKPPVVEVTRFSAVYPTNQEGVDYPKEWFRVQFPNQLHLVPTQGTLSQVLIGQAGTYLPLIYQGLSQLPQLFRISYKAGFWGNTLPYDIADAIGKLATISVLTARSDSIYPAGITNSSLGIDGLSQGLGFLNNGQVPAVFGSRIKWYKDELYGTPGNEGYIADLRMRYHGIAMQVI